MHEPDLRLKTAAGFVRQGSRAADIGTDHAYLPVYLILNNISPYVIASDLRKKPLENARRSISGLSLGDRIELRLSDGLDAYEPGEADDIIICGMGGNLITDILSRCSWIKDKRYRLILQPQSHAYDLREYLFSEGFSVIEETGVRSEGRVYTVSAAEYSGIKDTEFSDIDIYFGKLIYRKDDVSREICSRTLGYLKVRYKSELEYGNRALAEKFESIIKSAEVLLNEK